MRNLSDYFSLYRKWKNETDLSSSDGMKKLKIAVLCTFTLKGIDKVLYVLCRELGLESDIFLGGYNQIENEVLNPESGLYSFQPDIIFLFSDTQSLFGEEWFFFHSLSERDKIQKIRTISNSIISLADQIKNNVSAKLVVHNLEVPYYSSLGIMDNKQKTGFIESVKRINLDLSDKFKDDPSLFLFDYDQFCSRIGKEHIRDEKMYYLGDFKLDMKWLGDLADAWMAYIRPLASLTKKCIVLDLDNTLWGGIIGEDGMQGIKLGPDPEGRPYLEFQKQLLALYQRGIILAVNSKNNVNDVLEVLQHHPYMVLREDHFAAMQINWSDKASNIRQIAQKLNIGADSFVFFDDDPLNREMVRSELPEVQVPELPSDPTLYCKTLQDLQYFHSFFLSEEDRKKGEMYAQQRQRRDMEDSFTDVLAYLKALNMTVTIERANPFTIPRIAQLTQKTNQFNLTTRRYQVEDVKRFSESNQWFVVSIAVKDKFGDNGITGCAIVEKMGAEWRIDTFLLSCRVIGREIEKVLLEFIRNSALDENASLLKGEYILSEKNKPAKYLFRDCNFSLYEQTKNRSFWLKDVSEKINTPNIFEIIIK